MRPAPACKSGWLAAIIVAPVVITSSNTKIFCPFKGSPLQPKASRTFSRRSAVPRPT